MKRQVSGFRFVIIREVSIPFTYSDPKSMLYDVSHRRRSIGLKLESPNLKCNEFGSGSNKPDAHRYI